MLQFPIAFDGLKWERAEALYLQELPSDNGYMDVLWLFGMQLSRDRYGT